MWLTVTKKIHLAQKKELNRKYFHTLIFYNNTTSMNLIQFLAMKLHQGPVFMDGMVNWTEVVIHSKTNFVKVIRNQLLLRKPLMLYTN